jgi:hypothetical protein
MSTRGLRLLVYDDTCRRWRFLPWLAYAWMLGGRLFKVLGRIDHARGVRSWPEALSWLASVDRERPIEEIQLWGHGKWGRVMIGGQALRAAHLRPGSPVRPALEAVRTRMAGPDALLWFRCCEVFGTEAGHEFARALTRFFGCRAAGHTYFIAFWQSGLHVLAPGAEPDWPRDEGLAEGTPRAPVKSLWSRRRAPGTLSCLSLTRLPME